MSSESRNGSGWPQVTYVALAVLVVGLIFLWPYLGGPKSDNHDAEAAHRPAMTSPADAGRDALIKAAAEAAQASVNGRWEMIVERARAAAAAGPDRLHVFVWTLFTAFDALEADEQEGALRAFFETARDVRFSEVFTVGRDGWLMDWPTLRVALLDYVAQRRPALARELSIQVLQARPDEPGEWALAMRELVRGVPLDQWSSLVRVRLREFIYDRDWSTRGSASWMEGFDVLVAAGTAEALRDLATISTESPSRSARFVAFLTADRLVMSVPAACLMTLNRDPTLFSGATGVRAGLFARADLRDPAQLAEMEIYFDRGDVGPGERAQFAAAFPQLSAAPTHRLLTKPVMRSAEEVHAAEAAVCARLASWLEANRFPAWADAFGEIVRRLEAKAPPAENAS